MKLYNRKYTFLLFVSILCFASFLFGMSLEAKTRRKAKPTGIPAQLSTLKLEVNGREYDSDSIPGYAFENKTYYRLTDLAKILKNTYSQFDIVWNQNKKRTELKKHAIYHRSTAEEWDYPEKLIYVYRASAPIEVEGSVKDLHGFLYKGEFYVPLVETMAMVNVKVKWIPETLSLKLISEIPENVYPFDKEEWNITSNIVYDDRWANPKPNYMFYQDGYYFLIYSSLYDKTRKSEDGDNPKIVIEKLSSDMKMVEVFTLPYQGEHFGGFYHGKEYNYFLFGNDNLEEKDDATILRLVKTDHLFKQIASLDIKNTFTTKPFNGGTVSMSEWKDILVIHTSRECYRTADGLNHQSQLTVSVDTKLMKVLNGYDLGKFQVNHVSHSFNQFALHDKQNGDLFLVDHGDAHPRAVVLTKLDSASKQVKKEVNVIDIPGEIGANQTGIFVGGVEQSKNNILIAVNQIDYSKATGFDDYSIKGEDVRHRDIYLYTVGKNSTNASSRKLTDYSREQGVYYSAPKMIAIDENQFFLIWQKKRITLNSNGYSREEEKVLQYTIVDGEGQTVKEVSSLPWYEIGNGDLIYQDGYVWWQVRSEYRPHSHNEGAIYRVKVKK